jgi:hypothetical protein
MIWCPLGEKPQLRNDFQRKKKREKFNSERVCEQKKHEKFKSGRIFSGKISAKSLIAKNKL